MCHFFVVADYKEDNPRKRTKYTNSGSQSSKISGFLTLNLFCSIGTSIERCIMKYVCFVMTNKTTQSKKFLKNVIQRKLLQQLDLSKSFVYNFIFYNSSYINQCTFLVYSVTFNSFTIIILQMYRTT